ncbi:uncharacterized protein SPPG_09133 [Spizellomyces punctatus DAOM BR117]|uniref:Uncharacterized protein n=1 Tax=Spizellomyces punctatus (strain DAOM BR117) TaxID=645134 RepID=A0A0L0HM62_SPIPD|nr:uncharacterized protein SPPG_09133 [Spizellomyces punctatus DAOM BR117]KND01909.1 hypothetical protein SPPG_09133 [Spizellomyces punctatus DAOM BR117]|eukprot:XP_016609948.1 hypothetical protein SPPG_09133 [Spizellomyces punctatus DAOM BR117]
MIPWRQALHAHLVETLANNRLFQKFAVTTEQKISELSGKGARRAQEFQSELSNPETMYETKEKMMTFMEEFKKELKEGAERTFGGKR